MDTIQFTFSTLTTAFQATSPLTLVFQPSGVSVGTGFISKIVYEFPDKTVTRVYTYKSKAEALSTYKNVDTRAPLIYTFPGNDISPDGTTVLVAKAHVTTQPGGTVSTYTLSANIVLQYLTQNPTGGSSPYAFEEVHLLKTRVWGPGDSQLYILETSNPHYLLVNFDQGNEIPAVTNVSQQ